MHILATFSGLPLQAAAPQRAGLMAGRSVADLLRAIWNQPWVRLLFYVVLALVAFRLSRQLAGVIMTGLVAYALAFLVNPLLVWLEKRRIKRAFGVLLLIVVALAITVLLVWTLTAQVISLINDLPKLIEQLSSTLGTLLDRLSGIPGLENGRARLTDYLNAQATGLNKNLQPLLTRLVSSGGSLLGGALNALGWIGNATFALTLALYFMFDYERVGPSVLRLLPVSWQPLTARLSSDVGESFGGYIRGTLLVGLGAGVLVAAGLLALNVPNALALGLLVAVLNLVPYIGLLVAAVPAVLLALPNGWLNVVLVIAVYFITNQVAGNLLSPYILGRSSNLSPAAVLLALLVGLTLGGLLGGLLAVPVATLLKHWVETYWIPSRAHNHSGGG
ncbi:AI-2E family transporter (plasmid) [Deinococcus sp. KNUC1210]|uniref:AI-2E family transporter n=1 Tax=Deinococcus sp. KNUC1210 TaxID=2917691 RepID=UPI001EF02916|nr:AI-2E family transporter [Deinococcus sp. KNUC1210]ULH14301.1 AI-2E family transporter [Deinococcus sp. KNUC1210]